LLFESIIEFFNQVMVNGIALIGMPGSGKSSVGAQLALRLDWRHIDLDQYISQCHNKSISALINHVGEEQFRIIERDCLYAVLKQASDSFVLSTGGGTPVFHGNLHSIKEYGLVTVFLDCPVPVLESRISAQLHLRPLLSADRLEHHLENLKISRFPVYMQADQTIPANGSPEEIAEKILARLNLNQPS
jgi:shikimate kinase